MIEKLKKKNTEDYGLFKKEVEMQFTDLKYNSWLKFPNRDSFVFFFLIHKLQLYIYVVPHLIEW